MKKLAKKQSSRRWSLQDAKARFSEVVQRAMDGEPQIVSRHGKDAVVIVGCEEYAQALAPEQNMLDFFQSSPLAGLDLDFSRLRGGVREVDL